MFFTYNPHWRDDNSRCLNCGSKNDVSFIVTEPHMNFKTGKMEIEAKRICASCAKRLKENDKAR